jgi:hypothetical protein
MKYFYWTFFSLFLFLFSCTTFAVLENTKWNIVSYNNLAVSGSISFWSDTISSTFCNTVHQWYFLSGASIYASGLGISTLMACDQLYMDMNQYFTFFPEIGTPFVLSWDTLVIITSWDNVYSFVKSVATLSIDVVQDKIASCPEIWIPVCGEKKQCNNEICTYVANTYSSVCFAELESATVLYEGECQTTNLADDPRCIQKFDWCNTCMRIEWSDDWFCTEKYCEEIGVSYCLAFEQKKQYFCSIFWEVSQDIQSFVNLAYKTERYGHEICNVWVLDYLKLTKNSAEQVLLNRFQTPYYFARMYGMTTMQDLVRFRTDDVITRQEAAKMFVSLAEQAYGKSYDTMPAHCAIKYKDDQDFDYTLRGYIYDACAHDLMKWYQGKFDLHGNLTRGQALAVLMRIIIGLQPEQNVADRWMPYAVEAENTGLISFTNFDNFDAPITRAELIVWAQMIFKNSVAEQ